MNLDKEDTRTIVVTIKELLKMLPTDEDRLVALDDIRHVTRRIQEAVEEGKFRCGEVVRSYNIPDLKAHFAQQGYRLRRTIPDTILVFLHLPDDGLSFVVIKW